VLGSGGREHALVWKLRQSPRVSQLYCAPGNGGIADDAECVAVDLKSLASITELAERLRPDLTVVGPELPLTLGVVDEFSGRGWPVFGPTRAAAQLEASKSFAKEFLQRHRIPTAHFAICDSIEEVRSALGHFHAPVVVKADGLAAGKGVVIAKSKEEAASVAAETSYRFLCSATASAWRHWWRRRIISAWATATRVPTRVGWARIRPPILWMTRCATGWCITLRSRWWQE
jgi:phosphoribosylamine--glycine ligase